MTFAVGENETAHPLQVDALGLQTVMLHAQAPTHLVKQTQAPVRSPDATVFITPDSVRYNISPLFHQIAHMLLDRANVRSRPDQR